MSAANSMLYWIAGQIITCDSKVHYPKLSIALLAARKNTKIRHALIPYRCPVCNEWHLTKGLTK